MFENPLDINGRAGSVSLTFDVLAHVLLVLAACLAAYALIRAARVQIVPRALENVWRRLVLILGLAGAVAFFSEFFHNLIGANLSFGRAPLIWGTAMALTVPAVAAMAVPRRFAAALLCGWIPAAAALTVFYVDVQQKTDYFSFDSYGRQSIFVALGYTLLALLLMAIPFPRAAPIVGWTGCGAALIAAYILLTNDGRRGDQTLMMVAGFTLLAAVLVAILLLRRSPVLGWGAGSVGVLLLYFAAVDFSSYVYYSSLAAIGCTLLALLCATVPFARSNPTAEVEPAAHVARE